MSELKENNSYSFRENNNASQIGIAMSGLMQRIIPNPKQRGFEICKGFEDKEINTPKRSTKNSAGFDFECAEDITIYPMWNKPTLVPTGIKAYMQSDEALFLYNRSSNPSKKGLILANGVGVCDSDYFSNIDNDGNIMFSFYNFGSSEITIKKGEKIGQGVFQKYLKIDNDNAEGERQGGFGSTDADNIK